MMTYLISAEFYHEAKREAEKRGLQPREWIYIAWDRKYPPKGAEMRPRLRGRIGYDKDHLIGDFSELEIANLTRKS